MPIFNDILKQIDQAVEDFNASIPATQRAAFAALDEQVRRLDVDTAGRVKPTVNNLKIVNGIKNKLRSIIVSEKYLDNVKQFVDAFNTVTGLQNEYWTALESKFKPRPLLREIRTSAIQDTIASLTESGIGANITDPIVGILKTNITSGGSYADLTDQLRESLTRTKSGNGSLERYTRQITTDAIQQYNAQYTHIVSGDLGYEWFAYQGSDIETSRPFCIACTEFRYFHVSEIPRLLAADGLFWLDPKTGKHEPVPIYAKTGLPGGMIPGTNAENFFARRGGYNCGHQIRPVNEKQVTPDIVARVKLTEGYKALHPGKTVTA